MRKALQELGVRWSPAEGDRIVTALRADAPAVEDDEDDDRAAGVEQRVLTSVVKRETTQTAS
jgi:hypothetical protein